ncbi:MAG: hypothetical protein ACPIOQ_14950, partial [Promethearchaeia archaeon]
SASTSLMATGTPVWALFEFRECFRDPIPDYCEARKLPLAPILPVAETELVALWVVVCASSLCRQLPLLGFACFIWAYWVL